MSDSSRRHFAALLAALLVFLPSAVPAASTLDLIGDTKFERGFSVREDNKPGSPPVKWKEAGNPVWVFTHHHSKSSFDNREYFQFRQDGLTFEDGFTLLDVHPASGDADVVLGLNADKEYGGVYRQKGDPWPHVYLTQRISGSSGHLGPDAPSLAAMKAPVMLFLPSLQPHSLLSASNDVRMWVLVWKLADAPRFPKGGPVMHPLGMEEGARLSGLAGELSATGDDIVFNAGMRYLFLLLLREGGRLDPASGKSVHSALFRAIEILRHETDPPGALELAERVGLSKPHLLRTIRSETGLSLTVLRQTILLRRFMLLHAERASDGLLANALDAGFGSYNQFARVFVQAHGMTPAAYFRAR